jgi:hypothetical protein
MKDRIGDFLVKIKAMKPEQVDHVILLQQQGDKRRFGELALELNFVDEAAIKRYVDHPWRISASPER